MYTYTCKSTCTFQTSIHLNGELVKTLDSRSCGPVTNATSQLREEGRQGGGDDEGEERGDCTYSLEQLAYIRSGDKGNTANIGVQDRYLQCGQYGHSHTSY